MANEFHYCVSLSIVHPTIDPKLVTETIKELHPAIETKAGSERRRSDGTLFFPVRKAALSHWRAPLHGKEKLYSGDAPISDFILNQAEALSPYRNLFADLRREGEVVFRIGWFSDSNHSAGVLSAATLKSCGDIGVDIELNYYGPVINPFPDLEVEGEMNDDKKPDKIAMGLS